MLTSSSSLADWRSSLAQYDTSVAEHAKTSKRRGKLVELDEYVRVKLADSIASREEEAGGGWMSKEELCKVVEWKIIRGKFRPLMRYANALTPQEVETATREAFSHLNAPSSSSSSAPSLRSAMERLTSLKGIGPATASAVLSFHPARTCSCAFMSDEALRFFGITATGKPDGKLDYTLKNWEKLQKSCMEKAEELNSQQEEGDEEQEEWTACSVERAIWTDAAKEGRAN